jgi:hypothetical protein
MGDFAFGDLAGLADRLAATAPTTVTPASADAVAALLADPRPVRPAGAPEAPDVAPSTTIGGTGGAPAAARVGDACAVCRDEYAAGDAVAQLPCAHGFHPACLEPWLTDHHTCPVCRAELPAGAARVVEQGGGGGGGGGGASAAPPPHAAIAGMAARMTAGAANPETARLLAALGDRLARDARGPRVGSPSDAAGSDTGSGSGGGGSWTGSEAESWESGSGSGSESDATATTAPGSGAASDDGSSGSGGESWTTDEGDGGGEGGGDGGDDAQLLAAARASTGLPPAPAAPAPGKEGEADSAGAGGSDEPRVAPAAAAEPAARSQPSLTGVPVAVARAVFGLLRGVASMAAPARDGGAGDRADAVG